MVKVYKICDSLKSSINTKTENSQGANPGTGIHGSITMETSVPKAKDLGRSRGCCFTLFEYNDVLEKLKEYCRTQCSYAVLGYEVCPKTNKQHIQGYVHWDNPRSIGMFSKTFKNCHVEISRGDAKQNREYCIKDGKYEEFGDLPIAGKRIDWEKARDDLKTKSVVEVLEENPHLIPAQRALREFKAMMLKPLHREVNVIVLYGQAGVGKTRYAYDKHPDLYVKPVGQWWDGYTGQKAILLDDFYGWIEYHDLLRVLDRYPYNAPVKGGFVYAQWDTVYITSNKPPAQWYKHGLTPALERRLNKVMYMYNGENGEACYEAQGSTEATDHEA